MYFVKIIFSPDSTYLCRNLHWTLSIDTKYLSNPLGMNHDEITYNNIHHTLPPQKKSKKETAFFGYRCAEQS